MNEVVVAEDGLEAPDYLFGREKHTSRDIDQLPQLVLLDLGMPKLDGLELLHIIRANERMHRLPVFIFTSSQADIDRVASLRLDANSYIMKAVGLAGFSEAVNRLNICLLVLNHKPEDEHAVLERF